MIGAPWLLLAGFALSAGKPASAWAEGPPRAAAATLPSALATTSTAAIATTAPATGPTSRPVFLQSADVTQGNVGAWGQLQYVPIVLEMPEAYATVAQASEIHDRWTFAFRSRDEAVSLMGECGVTPEQLAMIPADAWATVQYGVALTPPDALLLALAPETRAALYARLTQNGANDLAVDPMWFRAGRVDFRLRGSGLSDESIAMLKRLLYPGPDGMLLFNEEKAAIRSIKDPAEKSRFLQAIERKRTLQARLLLTPTSDTAALARYWGKGGREANLRPLLDAAKYNAIAGVENPGRVNILSLLPPFVQSRLYRHADRDLPAGATPNDCFRTAFNFFSDTPDDKVHSPAYLNDVIARDYEKIDAPSELGDVILIVAPDGTALHAANYIADDIAFTKNGANEGAPWILLPIRDVIDTYRIKHAQCEVRYLRKRVSAG